MIDIRRMLYETTDAGLFWSNYLAGYLDVNVFGQIYMTDRGQEYLDDLDRLVQSNTEQAVFGVRSPTHRNR